MRTTYLATFILIYNIPPNTFKPASPSEGFFSNPTTKDLSIQEGATEVPHVPENGFVAIPERGMLLERTGTLITHSSYDVVSVVIQANKIPFTDYFAPMVSTLSCSRKQIHDLALEYQDTKMKYKNMTEAIFLSRDQLRTSNICDTFQLTNCHDIPHRQKRFIFGIAGLMTAGTALGLSTENRKQIAKIRATLQRQEMRLEHLRVELDKQKSFKSTQIKATEQLFGIVKGLDERIRSTVNTLNCFVRISAIRDVMSETTSQLKGILKFILNGQTYGRITPELINTAELQYIVENQISKTSRFYGQFFHILYQTGTASLIEADFNNMQFHFLLMYPNLENAPMAPFFAVRQVGFEARKADNSSVCLQFNTPPYAVVRNGHWYMLETPSTCPIFGRAMLCQNMEYKLVDFNNCLKLHNTSATNCPMQKCSTNKYLSTPVGILLRATESTQAKLTSTSVQHIEDSSNHLQTISKTIEVPMLPSRTLFIQWTVNISSVEFDKIVIHCPINADYRALVYLKPLLNSPKLTFEDLLSVPDIGSHEIATSFEKYKRDLDTLEQMEAQIRHERLSPMNEWTKWDFITVGLFCLVLLVLVAVACNIKTFVIRRYRKFRRQRATSRDIEPQDKEINTSNLARTQSMLSLTINNSHIGSAPPAEEHNYLHLPENSNVHEYMEMYPNLATLQRNGRPSIAPTAHISTIPETPC